MGGVRSAPGAGGTQATTESPWREKIASRPWQRRKSRSGSRSAPSREMQDERMQDGERSIKAEEEKRAMDAANWKAVQWLCVHLLGIARHALGLGSAL